MSSIVRFQFICVFKSGLLNSISLIGVGVGLLLAVKEEGDLSIRASISIKYLGELCAIPLLVCV
jgi:hypothetical protein